MKDKKYRFSDIVKNEKNSIKELSALKAGIKMELEDACDTGACTSAACTTRLTTDSSCEYAFCISGIG